MKLNQIYITIYIVLAILLIPTWFISEPSEEQMTYQSYTGDVTYLQVGQEIPIDHQKLSHMYQYDSISLINIMENSKNHNTYLNAQNEPMFVENHRSEFFASRHGLAIYLLLLYQGERIVHAENLGYYLQYFEFNNTDPSWVALNQDDFVQELEQNPAGKFYLSENIDLSRRNTAIAYFSGVLYNPYHLVISHVDTISNEEEQGLFYILDNAIIDGIVIEDSTVDRTTNQNLSSASIGFLSSIAYGSFISNINVDGDINFESYAYSGGLVGRAVNSIFRYVSFTGSIKNTGAIGGIIGSNSNYTEKIDLINMYITVTTNTIENAYVDAQLSDAFEIGGLIGSQSNSTQLNMKSVYATGTVENVGAIFYQMKTVGYLTGNCIIPCLYNYENAYTTYELIDYTTLGDGKLVQFIKRAQLFSDTPLPGLESFVFSENDLPRLPYWRIGS